MTPRETYADLGISIALADYPDIPGIIDVHATSFVETYRSEALSEPKLETDQDYLSRKTLEHFVFRSDFLERMVANGRERIDNQSEANCTLVARHHDRIVGFSHTTIEGNQSTVNALYILPQYQRRYIGQTLIRGLLDNTTVQKIDLAVVKDTPAIAFYRYHGFTITETIPEEKCPQMKPGKWLRLLKMVRENPNLV